MRVSRGARCPVEKPFIWSSRLATLFEFFCAKFLRPAGKLQRENPGRDGARGSRASLISGGKPYGRGVGGMGCHMARADGSSISVGGMGMPYGSPDRQRLGLPLGHILLCVEQPDLYFSI